MASLIPPKQPRRKGMPTLSIPARPASSSGNAAADAASAPQRPRPGPLLHTHTTTNVAGGHDDNTGVYDGFLPTTSSSNATSHLGPSIYPDTVPGPLTDQAALTQDLKRAIKGSGISEDSDLERNRPGLPSASSSSSSGISGSLDSHARPPSLHLSSPGSSSQRWGPLKDGSDTAADPSDDEEMVLKGQLETLSRLGEGASGEVRKARHRPSGMIMAVKTIATSPNADLHRQILRELSFNRTCQSPHIVRYFGAFLSEDSLSIEICMEFCEGGSLDAIYKRVKARNGRTGEKILGKVAECVLRGLDYLHERKIVHRDIKPSNILVTRSGQIKLCDFGVSGELVNSLAGTFTGTSFYMAPERIKGQNYTITSDVWSLGLTILEVASNRFPFPPDGDAPLGPIELLTYIIGMKTPELQDDPEAGIKWSRALRDFIERCLDKNPETRLGPHKMLTHPFIRKSETRQPQPDVGKFVAEVWGWPYPPTFPTNLTPIEDTPPTSAVAQQLSGLNLNSGPHNAGAALSSSSSSSPSSAVRRPSEALLARMPSLRKAPVTPSPLSAMTPVGGSTGAEASSIASSYTSTPPPTLKMPIVPVRRPSAADVQASASPWLKLSTTGEAVLPPPGMAPLERPDALGRSDAERLEARRREHEIGVIGSPVEDEEGNAASSSRQNGR